ncbi:sigma-70 RNA polymerase sigma factor region 4 domain-containing protein [Holzapfeliella sp. JNUCC 72]
MEQAFNQALSNSRVIHGAIKAAGIYHYRMDYQDFVQEGIINYAKVYKKYHPQEELTKINQLAFQKIKWQAIDQLRKQMRQSVEVTTTEEQWGLFEENSQLEIADVINQLSFKIQDKKRLIAIFDSGYSMCYLAQKENISTKYLQRLKQELKRQMTNN